MAAQLEEYLDIHLDAVLSSRRTATEPALRLEGFDRTQQDFVLHWVGIIAHTNAEMAYQFANYAGNALRHMDETGVEAWLIKAMDVFDTAGLHAGIAALQNVENFADELRERTSGLPFDESPSCCKCRISAGCSGAGDSKIGRLRIEGSRWYYRFLQLDTAVRPHG